MTVRLLALVILATLVSHAVIAADVTEFRKVDVFIADADGKKDARLEIDTDASEIRLVDEKRGATRATYAVIPIDQIAGLVYEAEFGKNWGGVVTTPPAKHWLTIRSGALASGSLRVRLDGDNQRELRFALRAVTGLLDDGGRPAVR